MARDKGDGTLAFDASYDGASDVPVFDNIYNPEPAKVSFSVKKQPDGRDLAAGEFSFSLADEGGTQVAAGTNAADGTVSFDALSFDVAGSYSYTMTEQAGTAEGVTYDTASHAVSVTVSHAADRSLQAAVSYDGADAAPIFKNSYTAPSAEPEDADDTPASDEPAANTGQAAVETPASTSAAAAKEKVNAGTPSKGTLREISNFSACPLQTVWSSWV